MKKSAFAYFILLLASTAIFAQQTTPTPPNDKEESIKISTSLIQVDVTVTDKNGNVVMDLRPEEFEIYQNGKKQTITNFSFISAEKTTGNPNPQTVKPDKNTIPIPPVKLKTEQVRRTYALVVDDLGINFGNIVWVKQSLKKFINEQMREGDLVAIIRTGSGIGALQSFTSDKRQLIAAIEKIRWNPQGRGGISTFEPIGTTLKQDRDGMMKSDGSLRTVQGTDEEIDFLKQTEEYRRENFSVGTLGALNYIIRGMSNLPGRKSVILFSEGFVLTSNNSPNQTFDTLRYLADLANRASVVIYTIDPRGLQVPMFEAQDRVEDLFDSRTTTEIESRRNNFSESQASLQYLAYQTGGVPFINQNNIDKGLRQAVNDQGSYYLLGYQPDDDTFNPKKNKYNQLDVKVTRPGVKVRHRSGFFGFTDDKIRNIPQTPQQRLINALTSPFDSGEINLNLYLVFQNDVQTGDFIEALVYINASDLQFTKNADKWKANFDLIAMTFGDNGVPIEKLSKVYTIEITDTVYRNMLKNGFVYTLSVPIKKTGAYQFRIALRDTASDKIGSASRFIEVPNVKKTLALSNIILDNFTAEEWQQIKPGEIPDKSEKSALLDTTTRQFKRGTILLYDYVIYTPKPNQPLNLQGRLIKDGKVVYEDQISPVKTDGQADLQRLVMRGALSLGKNLEVGTYVLQVIVSDTEKAKRFATQYIEFDITE